MPLIEILRIAFSSVAVNKLRSGLTMLGIAIGVFSVIGVMTAVTALRGSIESGLSILGSDMFQFAKYPAGIQDNSARRRLAMRRDITLEQAERYKELMRGYSNVICLKVFSQGAQAVYGGHKTTPGITLGGSDENFILANQYTINLGRNLRREDSDMVRPVCLIGSDIVKDLFPAENPLGKAIKVHGRVYTVVGTFAPKGQSFGQSQDDIIIVPITRFFADFGAEGRTVNIATQAPSQTMYNETVDHAITAMRIARGLRPEDDNDFELYSNDSLLTAFAKVADIFSMGSFVISGIALLAAGVGIMNIMLVSVTERTKEIGVRKSIGARKHSILSQFLIESVAISIAGGLVGILLGVGAGNAVALLMHTGVVFPWTWVGVGLGVCTVIGVGFGFYPAWKASSLDPIEALRYE
ncbi:macrolide export ATP-binding/permease protein MacB [mine drainage metagenome]|uniref:Macrolide export ATP-binding/permease protein MacB n=1 Tax=mine drainage metagenome TaxID=410659 RepID=A0A1J5STS9_9ZZZZ